MRKIHWFETKKLDSSTNYSTEIEPLKYARNEGIEMKYYCTFYSEHKYFGFENDIFYLASYKNKFIKGIEFRIRVLMKMLSLLCVKNVVIVLNYKLIKIALAPALLNKLFKLDNKFVLDMRTTPVVPESFEKDMTDLRRLFRYTLECFHGYTFITPAMEAYLLKNQKISQPTAIWSSGVDLKTFKPKIYGRKDEDPSLTIFYHGGLSISRGNLALIQAVQIIRSSGYDVRLIQVGQLVDTELVDYISENRMGDYCQILEPVSLDLIPDFIDKADLVVLPFPDFMAWRVSSPLKLMEYLAMGKNILAPNIEAIMDVVPNDAKYLSYFDSSVKDLKSELAMKIKLFIDRDSLETEAYHADARSFARSNFGWDIQCAKFFDFLAKL